MDHLSATQINMFLRCERQWYYRYVQGIRIPPPGAVILGGAYHDGVEHAYRVRMEEGELPSAEDCQDVFRAAFDQHIEEEEEIDWGDDHPGVLIDRGVELVKLYVDNVAPQVDPVAVEAGFSLPYEIPVIGFIDLVADEGGSKSIIEHKTSRRRGGLDRYGLQMGIYRIALEKDWGLSVGEARVHQALTTAKPDINVESVPIEAESMIDLVVGTMIQKINLGIFAPTGVGTWACSEKWCGYYKLCHERRK